MSVLRHIPNAITIARLLFVFPVCYSLYTEQYEIALALFAVAGLSDGLDGLLARHFNWTTRFGAIADPLADKLLLVLTYLILTINEQLPIWLLAVVIGRDIIIISGATAYHFIIGPYKFNPTLLGKLSTMCQIGLILLLLVSLALFQLPHIITQTAIWIVFIIGVVSGLDYVRAWGIKAYHAIKENNQ